MWITKAKLEAALTALKATISARINGAMKVAELDLKNLERRVIELEKKFEAKVRPAKANKPAAKAAPVAKPRGRTSNK